MSLDDDEPIWLDASQAISINRLSLDAGERHRVRDRGILEGALARPFMLWSLDLERDLYALAARLTAALAKAHAFEQGNKRTAFQCGLVFLMTNGTPVEPLDEVGIAKLVELIVEGDPDAETALAIVYREFAVRLLG